MIFNSSTGEIYDFYDKAIEANETSSLKDFNDFTFNPVFLYK